MCKLETRLLTLFFTMDLNNINQEEIIQKITDEVLKELQNSKTNFTNDDIKNKINEKIDSLLSQLKNEQLKEEKVEGEKEDEFLREEFTNINNSSSNNNSWQNNDAIRDTTSVETQLESEQKNEENIDKDIQEKKQFFKEFTDLYKEELDRSIDSFKRTLESFSLMKESSFIEKFLIILFLSIPAIIAGLIGFLFIGILLILWQIYIFIRIFTRSFDKIEASIKEAFNKIKIKISSMKNGTGFLNRIIFSNLLYSVLMFNGLLYVLVKGLAFPIRSLAEIDKIIANLASRSINLVSNGLRGPSELALRNLRTNNAMGRDKSKGSTEPTKSRQILRLNERLRASNRARDILKSKLNRVQNISKRDKNNIKPKVSLDQSEIRKNIFDRIQKNVIENQVKNLVDQRSAQITNTQQINNTNASIANVDLGRNRDIKDVRDIKSDNKDFNILNMLDGKIFDNKFINQPQNFKNHVDRLNDNRNNQHNNGQQFATEHKDLTAEIKKDQEELSEKMKHTEKSKLEAEKLLSSEKEKLEEIRKNPDSTQEDIKTQEAKVKEQEQVVEGYDKQLKDLQNNEKGLETSLEQINNSNNIKDLFEIHDSRVKQEGEDVQRVHQECIEKLDQIEKTYNIDGLTETFNNSIVKGRNIDGKDEYSAYLLQNIAESLKDSGVPKDVVKDVIVNFSDNTKEFAQELSEYRDVVNDRNDFKENVLSRSESNDRGRTRN